MYTKQGLCQEPYIIEPCGWPLYSMVNGSYNVRIVNNHIVRTDKDERPQPIKFSDNTNLTDESHERQ